MYFTTPEQGAVFEEFVAARRSDGLDMTLIDGAEVRRLVPPIREDVLGASYCSDDAQIVTSTVVDAFARGAKAEGATIREGVTVERLVVSGDRVEAVETDAGRFSGDAIVVATGAWSTALLADVGVDVPIGGERLQVAMTGPQPFWIEPLVFGPNATRQYALFRDLPSWDPAVFTTPVRIATAWSCCHSWSSGHPASSASVVRPTTRASSMRTRRSPGWRRSRTG